MYTIYMYVKKEITKPAYIETTGVSSLRGWALSPQASMSQQSQCGAVNWTVSGEPLVLSQQWKPGNASSDKESSSSSNRETRQQEGREPTGTKGKQSSFCECLLHLGCYKKVLLHCGWVFPHPWGSQDNSSGETPYLGDFNLWQIDIKTGNHTWEGGTSIEDLPPWDWPMGMSV